MLFACATLHQWRAVTRNGAQPVHPEIVHIVPFALRANVSDPSSICGSARIEEPARIVWRKLA
jgi:hypothetical protein